MKKVVVIGGGTGTYVVLSGLKKYDLELSAIVSMMDSGGSTGRLRDQLGVLPPGDLRQCLVALSDASDLWRRLFLYRFKSGDLKGHNFGNIFLTALEKTTSDYNEVVNTASYILKTRGKVIPVTFDKTHLCVTYMDGETIKSEELIDNATHKQSVINKAFLTPPAKANQQAIIAILNADFIVIGPGDLYTSLIPNFVVDGIKKSLQKSSAKIICVVNLMTKRGQTTDYTAKDHVDDLKKYLGRKIDFIIINSGKIPPQAEKVYKKHFESVVVDDIVEKENVFRLDLLSKTIYNQSNSDHVMRSIVRHDSDKLSDVLYRLINKNV